MPFALTDTSDMDTIYALPFDGQWAPTLGIGVPVAFFLIAGTVALWRVRHTHPDHRQKDIFHTPVDAPDASEEPAKQAD